MAIRLYFQAHDLQAILFRIKAGVKLNVQVERKQVQRNRSTNSIPSQFVDIKSGASKDGHSSQNVR